MYGTIMAHLIYTFYDNDLSGIKSTRSY